MIVHSDRTVVTSAVHAWADAEHTRMVWLAGCLARHLAGDWGDLDADDRAVNDHALRRGEGRLLSAYELPPDLAGTTVEAQGLVITDDHPAPSTDAPASRQGHPRVQPRMRWLRGSEPLAPVVANRLANFSHIIWDP